MTRIYTEGRYRRTLRKIDPEREYNISEMMRDKLFWWVTDVRSYRHAVIRAGAELKPKVTGAGLGKRYKIKGRNISRFIEKYGPGIEFITTSTHGKEPNRAA